MIDYALVFAALPPAKSAFRPHGARSLTLVPDSRHGRRVQEGDVHINDLLKIASERGASDLHLKVGSHPVIRVHGDLQPLVELKRLMQEDTIAMAFSIMSGRQQ